MSEIDIFQLFLLVMVRVSGLLISAPILGSANFPMLPKAGLAGLMAVIITPTIARLGMVIPEEPLAFALVAASEFLIGIAMGFVMSLVFTAIQVGGQIMDMQSGFGMMNVFNPAMETQFPIFGFFLFILATLYFLVLSLHHVMIRALVASFESIPIGGFVYRPGLLWEVSTWGRGLFIDGLMIAAPVAAAMLLAYASMGLLGRVVPQIHLFVVGFPITIATALIVVAGSIGVYMRILDGMFFRMFQNVETLLRGMG